MISRRLATDLSNSFPGSVYIPRGKQSLDELAQKCESKGRNVLCVLGESHGNPVSLGMFEITRGKWNRTGEFKIKAIKTRSDFAKNRQKFSSISLDISSPEAKRLAQALRLENDSDAELLLRERNGNVSFFAHEKEIGPVITIKEAEAK